MGDEMEVNMVITFKYFSEFIVKYSCNRLLQEMPSFNCHRNDSIRTDLKPSVQMADINFKSNDC